MVIVNPKLSLPTDLPYKKRQRPFFPNTPLQQATIKYNEAIRKKYNDIQFAKRLENGTAPQNDTTGINTVEISKMVDPALFSEMSTLNPLSIVKKRRSKRYDSPPTNSSSGDLSASNSSTGKLPSTGMEGTRQHINFSSAASSSAAVDTFPTPNGPNNFICDNDNFPQLQATVNMECEKLNNTNTTFFSANVKPPSSASLETQAINEYEPTIDSAHDMIFGNVMGINYGNYIHGPLWTPAQQQGCANNSSSNGTTEPSQQFHTVSPSLCCSDKVNGTLHQPLSSSSTSYGIQRNDANDAASVPSPLPLPMMGKHCGGPGGSGRRSTSVPRPRTGTQKETLKQAAIRCGIIKGNQIVSSVPKRSHCLVPLQLAPVQSDPVVSVVDILHPKGTIPACSSEAIVDFEGLKFKTSCLDANCSDVYVIHNNKSTPALNIAMNMTNGDSAKLDSARIEKCHSEGHGQVLTEFGSPTVSRMLENVISCPTL